MMVKPIEFSKYERSRIIGARALQISMDAPLLLKIDKEDLNEINYDPLRIAEKELDSGVLPISVNKPKPLKRQESIESVKIEESDLSDEEKIKAEEKEEKEIAESGEMMDLANVDEEKDFEDDSSFESSDDLE